MIRPLALALFLFIIVFYAPLSNSRSPAVEPGVVLSYEQAVTTPETAPVYNFKATIQEGSSSPIPYILLGVMIALLPFAAVFAIKKISKNEKMGTNELPDNVHQLPQRTKSEETKKAS